MKKIAVFGGAGFLGTYLVEELVTRGFDTTVFDLAQPKENRPETSYVQLDILDQDAVKSAFEMEQFDVVYNLAGFANLDKAVGFPLDTIRLNILGNMHILEECIKHKIKRFVYASSAYAMSDKGSFYGISKLSSEKIIEEYANLYQLDYTILRYGSIYSERDFENNYIYNIVRKAVETGVIHHEGDGNEVREYIHAVDAAKLSVDVAGKDEFINKHLVLTGVERMKRLELFELINEILGNGIDIQLSSDGYHNHYKYTPYSFSPQESQKLTPNPYIDMGQGILNCIREAHKK